MKRHGYTLVEILIVMGIMLLLAISAASYFDSGNSRRVSESVRVLQASILKSVQLAQHSKANAGLKPVIDPQAPYLITGFTHVKPRGPLAMGNLRSGNSLSVRFIANTSGSRGHTIRVSGGDAAQLLRCDQAGMIPRFAKAQIPSGESVSTIGGWYQLREFSSTPLSYVKDNGDGTVDLETMAPVNILPDQDLGGGVVVQQWNDLASFSIKLSEDVTQFQPIASLPAGVVVDARWSSIGDLPIMFSPQGSLVGRGMSVVLVLRSVSDVVQYVDPRNPGCKDDWFLVTIRTNGTVEVGQPNDPNANLVLQ